MAKQGSEVVARAKLIVRMVNQMPRQKVRSRNQPQQRTPHPNFNGRTPESFSSPTAFMEYARRLLKEEGYSRALMERIFREAHRFADARLQRRQRSRLHAFLCQADEKLRGLSLQEQEVMLQNGRRAFRDMRARNL